MNVACSHDAPVCVFASLEAMSLDWPYVRER